MLPGMANLSNSKQQNYFTPNSQQQFQKHQPFTQSQLIIFDEIGGLASQIMYNHVNDPLNLTALYDQADLFTSYLQTHKNTTTSTYKRIPFTKAVRDEGDHGLRRLNRILKRLENMDHNLPHVEKRQTRESKIRKKRGEQACFHGYSSQPELYDLKHDVAQMALDPLQGIIEAIRRPRYEDTEEYKTDQINHILWYHEIFEKQILEHYVTPKSDFPEEYWEAYLATPEPTTTTFRPFDINSGETRLDYVERKSLQKTKMTGEIYREKQRAEKLHHKTLSDFYIHIREKRLEQMVPLATNIVGIFMGAFNPYEIQQLKSKFQEISNRHNMLVRVTQQHDVDLRQMKDSLKSIVNVINLMAEYSPGLIQLQISEQINIFEDRVTIITNAIQQLHHRR
jgi:hypothetical protein